MSFNEFTPQLEIVQEELKTRSEANDLIKIFKKRIFIIAKQKKKINKFESAYTSSITSIRRSFELRHLYMISWSSVRLFLFLLQSILELLFHHINQKIQTTKKSWNTLTMMKLRQWIAIRVLMIQKLTKIATIQSFWSREIVNNSSLSRHRYQAIERHLNVEFNSHMSYNNASWFWKIEHVLNVFRNQLFLFTISDSHLIVNESAIKFHDRNSNKFRLAHKSAKKNFVLYVLISEKDILHDFMLWDSRDDLEYHKQSITINISSRITRERKKSTTEVTAMKMHLSSTKEVIYTLCERVTRDIRHLHFVCFLNNLFTNSHLVRALLTLNIDVCDIVRDNASDISQELKIIVAAKKSQLTLKQWLHRVVNEMINCFVWRDAQRDHVITFDTTAYTSQISEQTFRKTRHITDISLRDDTLRVTIEQFIIAVQYNLHMSHVNRANQLRTNLTIARSQKLKWIMRMIEYMLDSVNINAYIVWAKHQAKKNLSHRDRRVFI